MRKGHGKWCPIKQPVPGVLWIQDDGEIGFEPLPGKDKRPILDLFDEHGEQAWTILTDGKPVFEGMLDNWAEDNPL